MHQLLQLDKNALLWINGHHNWLLDALLAPVAYAGECGAIWVLTCFGLLVFGSRRHKWLGLTLLVTMIVVDRLVAHQIGHLLYRERPYAAIEAVRQLGVRWSSGSFPSGHAHNVWVASTIVGNEWRRLRLPLVVFALLTCYSRPYFGMHYPLDVVAGAAIGIVCGLAVVAVGRIWQRRGKAGKQCG